MVAVVRMLLQGQHWMRRKGRRNRRALGEGLAASQAHACLTVSVGIFQVQQVYDNNFKLSFSNGRSMPGLGALGVEHLPVNALCCPDIHPSVLY
jgi:hypothetical protein